MVMSLQEKLEIKERLLTTYTLLNDIKKRNYEEMLDEAFIKEMNVFHKKLEEYLK